MKDITKTRIKFDLTGIIGSMSYIKTNSDE
jgi:hypothetical protein